MSLVSYPNIHSRSNHLSFCKSCKKDVIPKVVFYHNEPDVGVCPDCQNKVKSYKNSSKFEDSILKVVVAGSTVVYLISLFVR